MSAKSALSYRVATLADHALVVTMLEELVDELGHSDTTDYVKKRLGDDIRTAFEVPHIRIFVAELNGEGVGLSRGDILVQDPIFRLREDNRCGYVDQMYVRPAWRDAGVGAELLAMCEAWFRQQGIAHCLLHAAPRAIRFYARVGYQPNREMFKRL